MPAAATLTFDGMTAFRQAYEVGGRFQWLDHLAGLAADGRPVGVHFIIASDQRTGLPTNLAAAVQGRIILRMASTEDYSVFGVPGELGEEGPFAEVTGYYAKREPRPVVHVRKIHRRRNPVFQTILSGKEVWNSVGLLGEANVLALVSKQVPGVKDVYFTHGGGGFYHAVVSIAQKRAGWSKQALLATFANEKE